MLLYENFDKKNGLNIHIIATALYINKRFLKLLGS